MRLIRGNCFSTVLYNMGFTRFVETSRGGQCIVVACWRNQILRSGIWKWFFSMQIYKQIPNKIIYFTRSDFKYFYCSFLAKLISRTICSRKLSCRPSPKLCQNVVFMYHFLTFYWDPPSLPQCTSSRFTHITVITGYQVNYTLVTHIIKGLLVTQINNLPK